ncbi:hypothetical protein [Elstera cyanobacteriorum]|uniref:hypothetical protein n=1 Tax=Elstera cyanobacteriorum TaxID=2022747 RepID=UPI002354F5D2|nr:hypothetical protein [Elstera cyanobacteriorum]MCK6441548.1 hypothetical protein [Elstera cyanobacteriorum]
MAAQVYPSPDLARFLEGPVTAVLAVAGPGGIPVITRGIACQWRGDEVGIFLNGLDRTMIDPVPPLGAWVAGVMCRPTSLQTYQIKGRFLGLRDADAGEQHWLLGAVERMVVEFQKVDYPEPQSRAYLGYDPALLTVFRYRPEAIFDQTPGPQAGRQIAGAA